MGRGGGGVGGIQNYFYFCTKTCCGYSLEVSLLMSTHSMFFLFLRDNVHVCCGDS